MLIYSQSKRRGTEEPLVEMRDEIKGPNLGRIVNHHSLMVQRLPDPTSIDFTISILGMRK